MRLYVSVRALVFIFCFITPLPRSSSSQHSRTHIIFFLIISRLRARSWDILKQINFERPKNKNKKRRRLMTLRPGSTENQSAKHVSVRVHIRVVPLLCVLGSITSGSDWEEALYSLAHALRVRGPKPSGAYCGMCLEVTMQWLVYNIKQIRQQASVRIESVRLCISRTLSHTQRPFFVIIKHNPLLYSALPGHMKSRILYHRAASALARAESDGCIHLSACSISQTSSERRI